MKKSLGFVLFLLSAPLLFAQTTVTGVLPAAGVTTGGEFVHIRGNRLNSSPALCPGASCAISVKFGDAFGRIVSNTSYEIVAIAPPHAAGSVDVTVSIAGVPNPFVLTNAYRYHSRSIDDVERILLPVAASGPGPNSARFETEILITNAGDESVPVSGAAVLWNSGISPPPVPGVSPHTTRTFTDSLYQAYAHTGAFIYVPARLARDVITKVRIHDTSRDDAAFGVEMPAVSDLDFAATVRLTGIPTDARFRSTLRVYAYDARNFGPVTLRVRDNADGTLLATVPVALNAPSQGEEDLFPAAAQRSLDSIIAPLRGHARLRIDIADSDAVRPIWGFISITNNQTQEITVVTPQRSGPAATPENIPTGWWIAGSNLINVGATDATVYLRCSVGTFKTAPLDSDGRFTTTGSLSGGGGPPPPGGPTPLKFDGRVADGWLTLTMGTGSGVGTTTAFQFVGPQQPGPLPPLCP
jgi:hypothetical protein